MTKQERIERTKEQIRDALEAYTAHTHKTDVLDRVSDEFIDRLANDAVEAKQELREILSKSPAWNDDMDCLVINGNRTHDKDSAEVSRLAWNILRDTYDKADEDMQRNISNAITFFTCNDEGEEDEESVFWRQSRIDAIKAIAPNAYAPGKKPSRIFKAICKALNIEENREFNQNYALLADELGAKKIDFKLYVSINPAHFLTMSNPKQDRRGEMLTSCHSLNGGGYHNGCIGYARDGVTMIAFTVADSNNPESQYNRKTSRQLFMYRPNNGLLLQSRFYNSQAYGGTRGEQPESKIYRELVQKELADGENAVNLWKTRTYYNNSEEIRFAEGLGFGGYADWPIEEFCAKFSIRKDHAEDYKAFSIGTYGLCIVCGDEISNDLLCGDCDDSCVCDECEDHYNEDDMYSVIDRYGNRVYVCEDCLSDHYFYCEDCDEYHHSDCMNYIESEDRYVCDDCIERDYIRCDDCGEWVRREDSHTVYDANDYEVDVCESCLENDYFYCEECEEYHHTHAMNTAYKDGVEVNVCDDCLESSYTECEECEEYHHNDDIENGRCKDCQESEEEAC